MRKRFPFAIGLAALLLAGCGSGSTSPAPAPAQLSVQSPSEGWVTEGKTILVSGQVAPEATVRVQCTESGVDEVLPVDGEGTYSREIPAEAGTNQILIEAKDKDAKVSSELRTVIRNAHFLLAAAECDPGSDPAHVGAVYLFLGKNKEALAASISPALTNDPSYVAFGPTGELFVANRHGNTGSGSIARFLVDDEGGVTPNGVITGNGLAAVHGLAFSASGELFAANYWLHTISRFTFDAGGNAVPNGSFSSPLPRGQGLAFSPTGELFATGSTDRVARFLFDPDTGAAVGNGTFAIPGTISLHGIHFIPEGELFVGDQGVIYRYLLDEAGAPVGNGTITLPAVQGVIGLAYTPARDLFVATHGSDSCGLYRYSIPRNQQPVLLESFTLGSMGGAAVRERLTGQ